VGILLVAGGAFFVVFAAATRRPLGVEARRPGRGDAGRARAGQCQPGRQGRFTGSDLRGRRGTSRVPEWRDSPCGTIRRLQALDSQI